MDAAAAVSVGAEVLFPGGLSLQCFTSPELYVSLAIFALALCLTLRRVHPIALILISAAGGITAGYLLDLPL